jgi:two-component system, NarL family, sensor histidine kinase UhpB
MSYSGAKVLQVAEQNSVSQQLNPAETWPDARTKAAKAGRGLAQAVAAQRHRPTGPGSVRRHTPARLHDVLEKEVKRMAQSLHDEAGQLLAAVHLKLDEVNGSLPAAQRDSVRQLKSMLDQLEGELRRLSHELRPMILDDLGLLPAVEFLRQGVTRRTGLRIEVQGSTAGRLPARIETALYRIVHEALGMIASHARARRVTISFLTDATRIQCSVSDDGVALDASEVLAAKTGRSLSLLAIRERVEDLSGTVAISSGQKQGAELVVSIPMNC